MVGTKQCQIHDELVVRGQEILVRKNDFVVGTLYVDAKLIPENI